MTDKGNRTVSYAKQLYDFLVRDYAKELVTEGGRVTPRSTPPPDRGPRRRINYPAYCWAFILLIVLMNTIIFLGDMHFAYMQTFNFNNRAILAGQYYRMITSVFLHADPHHLIWNMVSLIIVSRLFFNRLGVKEYIACYLGGGLAGSAAMLLSVYGEPMILIGVGCSAAIFGLLGACIAGVISMVLHTKQKGGKLNTAQKSIILNYAGLLVIMFGPGLLSSEINSTAHFAGFVAGSLIGTISRPTPRLP